jgi:glycosyltransferase involved in cell wall biosynthesis
MQLSNASIFMAMTSRIKDGKRQGLTISSKLMADFLEKRAKRLVVIDEPLRKGWTHYLGMLKDYWRVTEPKYWPVNRFDLLIGFDVVNAIAMRNGLGTKVYAVDDQARPHNSIVKWVYGKLDSMAREKADFILESSPNRPNGLLMPSLCPPLVEEHFVFKKEPIIGYLGSLDEGFGVDKAIKAMPEILESIPDARLEIVGSGPQKRGLEDLVMDMGLNLDVEDKGWISRTAEAKGSVKFYGFLSDEEAVEVVRKWRVGVAPYTEAMAGIDSGKARFYAWAGVPSVVSPDTPEMVNLVEDFEAGTSGNLVSAVVSIIKSDFVYTKYLNGCRKMAEHFDAEKYFDSLFKVLLA